MGEFYLPLTFLLAGFLTEELLSFAFLSNGFFVAVFFGTRGVFFSLLEISYPAISSFSRLVYGRSFLSRRPS